MANHRMTNRFLIVALVLIGASSYEWRSVTCDASINAQVNLQQQQQQVQPSPGGAFGAGAAAGAAAGGAAGGAAGAAVAGAGWEQSGFYLASFDPAITTIPSMQREFVNKIVENDLELFREILREAIERRNKFAPSVGLIWKYAAKLLGRLISNRREEMKLPERLEPKPDFFRMLADLAEAVIQQSTEVKKQKGYSKSNVDTDELYRRVDNVFKYIQSTIEAAPVGAYLKWNELILFRGDPTNPDHDRPLVDEASDLTAVSGGSDLISFENSPLIMRPAH